jgi:hypothetical protein
MHSTDTEDALTNRFNSFGLFTTAFGARRVFSGVGVSTNWVVHGPVYADPMESA